MEELIKLLEEAIDKFEIISNRENILGKNITINQMIELIDTYLTNEEKIIDS